MAFKFGIGDIVIPVMVLEEARARARAERSLQWFLGSRVKQRISEECCGGVQRFYLCELMGRSERYSEDSLMPMNMFCDLQHKLFAEIEQEKKGRLSA